MFTILIRNFIQLFLVLLFAAWATYASKHHCVNTFQDVRLKISSKYGHNLKGLLVAIDLDKMLVDINEKEEAVLIDPFAPEFIKFILNNGGDILFLTARTYKNGGDRWGIADVSSIDGGQSLKLVEQKWKKYFYSQKISYPEKKGIIFMHESPPGYPEDVKMNSLFSKGILFSRDCEVMPCKGLCLHKFIKLTNLSHIHTVMLIDDQEGYLDEFHYCFSKEKSDAASVNVETFHFIS